MSAAPTTSTTSHPSAKPLSARGDALLRLIRQTPPASLTDASGLDDVETLMLKLANHRDGLAGEMAAKQLRSGGKRLRARLALRATEALGGTEHDAVAWAAAVELLHNATLVHDDIQDGDTVRRGVPTLWAEHGVAQAINAGDLLMMLPWLAIADIALPVRGELACALAAHATRTVRGQAAELDMLPSGKLDWASYLGAVEGKTGALIGLPVHGAALLAGRSTREADMLGNAFMPLGVLFQLQDDVLDLYGDKGRREIGCDLYEGKVSALVVAHLQHRPSDVDWLLPLLRAPREATDPCEVARAITCFRASGALEAVLAHIELLAARVAQSPLLAQNPALHAVAVNLAGVATAPIRHLRTVGEEA